MGIRSHIGLMTLSTSGVSIASTGSDPSSGKTYLRSVISHSCRCFGLVHSASLSLMNSRAHCSKVIALASAARSAARRARLWLIGSIPSARSLRASAARSLASARLKVWTAPSDMSRTRPLGAV